MRHFLLPGTVAALPLGMGMAATRARLIAHSSGTLGIGASQAGTAAGAVALAAIAPTANEHRASAADTEVASSRRFHWQGSANGRSTGSGER